jgi:hypothetical protein
MREPFEEDREANAVGELEGVDCFDIQEPAEVQAANDPLQGMLAAIERRREQDEFLLRALRRNGVL